MRVAADRSDDTRLRLLHPAALSTTNLKQDLALRVGAAARNVRPDDWRGIQPRENVIKRAMYDVLHDQAKVERIFLIIRQQGEY